VTDAELRDPSDFSKGGRILAGQIFLRDVCVDQPGPPVVGFVALSRYWTVTNATGEDVVSVLVNTEGTDNTNPTSVLSVGSRRMTEYDNFLSENVTESLERIAHQWSKPIGGVLADGETTKIALQQDVWDWTVSSARVITAAAQIVPAAVVNTIPFFAPDITAGIPAEGQVEEGHRGDGISGGLLPGPVGAKTLLLTNGSTQAVEIERVLLALVGDLDPTVIDDALLEQLEMQGRFEEVSDGNAAFGTSLDPGDAFYLVLEGDVIHLPSVAIAKGDFFVSNRPGIMDEPLVVGVVGSNGGTRVTSYALWNTGVYVPEPGSGFLMTCGLWALVSVWRRDKGIARVAPSPKSIPSFVG
jgi:hypothetical protein